MRDNIVQTDKKYRVPAVDQAIHVMLCLADNGTEAKSLTDITREVGIHRSKAFSILSTLNEYGFVKKNPNRRGYVLGTGLLALAGHLLEINPFDQPNVESAKVRAREMMKAYAESGVLPQDRAEAPEGGVLEEFLRRAAPGDYVGIQAYVKPDQATSALLQQLRLRIRDRFRVATTVGYGPRFLHSTGQLHKGDGGAGLFIQFTDRPGRDAAIPDTAGAEPSGRMIARSPLL